MRTLCHRRQKNQMNKNEKIALLIIGLFFLGQFAYWGGESALPGRLSSVNQSRIEIPVLEAEAAFVWDASLNKVIYEKNSRAKMPLASLAKIMTALAALESGVEKVTVGREAVGEEGDTGLLVGENWNTDDLAAATLISSSNDGAATLSSSTANRGNFVISMNELAARLGLAETNFSNETGLDVSENGGGAYGSAENIGRLLYYAITRYPEVFEVTAYQSLRTESLSRKKHVFENTNRVIGEIPGALASKTGYTDLASGNLAVAFNAGIMRPIIVVVMGSSENGRFEDVKKLVSYAQAFLAKPPAS